MSEVWIVTTDCDCMSGRMIKGVYLTEAEAKRTVKDRWTDVLRVPVGVAVEC